MAVESYVFKETSQPALCLSAGTLELALPAGYACQSADPASAFAVGTWRFDGSRCSLEVPLQ